MKLSFVLLLLVVILTGCESEFNKSELKKRRPNQTLTNKSNIKLPKIVLDSIKSGDIVLRRGDGPLSFHLSNTTKEPFTHCGIIVKEHDQLKVIHSLGGQVSQEEVDGVQITSLKHFVDYASDSLLYICRPIFTDNANTKITAEAYRYLDLKIPFDHRFSMLSKDKFYCSELLYYVFKNINQNENVFVIKKKHRAYMLMFSTFFNSKNFKKIYAISPVK
jgi:hypothetical protein